MGLAPYYPVRSLRSLSQLWPALMWDGMNATSSCKEARYEPDRVALVAPSIYLIYQKLKVIHIQE